MLKIKNMIESSKKKKKNYNSVFLSTSEEHIDIVLSLFKCIIRHHLVMLLK